MNNKGFTLIELVGTIVILAVIALLAFPALMGMLNNGQNQVDDSVKSVLESAAEGYVNDHIDDYPKNGTQLNSVSVCTLVDEQYISLTFYKKNRDSIGKGVIEVTVDGERYLFQYEENGNPEGCPSYDNIE